MNGDAVSVTLSGRAPRWLGVVCAGQVPGHRQEMMPRLDYSSLAGSSGGGSQTVMSSARSPRPWPWVARRRRRRRHPWGGAGAQRWVRSANKRPVCLRPVPDLGSAWTDVPKKNLWRRWELIWWAGHGRLPRRCGRNSHGQQTNKEKSPWRNSISNTQKNQSVNVV